MEWGSTPDQGGDLGARTPQPRLLPSDLPKSLEDRQTVPSFGVEAEFYDGWQGANLMRKGLGTATDDDVGQRKHRLTVASVGESQLITSPVPPQPFHFSLPLDGPAYDGGRDDAATQALEDSENRLVGMLAAQAAHREDGSAAEDEDAIAVNRKLSVDEKRDLLQKALNMAASNGDVERIQRLIDGKAKDYVDVNAPDEDGTAPLIYASCFVSVGRASRAPGEFLTVNLLGSPRRRSGIDRCRSQR